MLGWFAGPKFLFPPCVEIWDDVVWLSSVGAGPLNWIAVAHDPSDWSLRLEIQEVHHPLLRLYVLQVGETGIHKNAAEV